MINSYDGILPNIIESLGLCVLHLVWVECFSTMDGGIMKNNGKIQLHVEEIPKIVCNYKS